MSSDTFSLTGQVVVVTGAGRGIGRAIANAAADAGATVAIGSRSADELKQVQAEIESRGGTCSSCIVDVTDLDSMQRFVDTVISEHGVIDGLVNNAGDNLGKAALDIVEEEFDHLVAVNYKSVYFLSQMVVRTMVERQRGGAIVNVSSQAGCIGAPGRAPYSGAKAAVNNVTRSFAAEWAPLGIRVNAVAPTFTRTPLAEAVLAGNEALRKKVTESILLGRPAEPEEIAAPVVFLLSPAASMITGHTLLVDGGWTAV